jgi:alkylation response protein AidB-like acyl-CoA dehydrogenase
MHVLLNDEERLLAESVFQQARDLGAATPGEFRAYDDSKLWAALAAMDVLGLGLPASVGGVGTILDAAIVAMSLGRALAPVSYLGGGVLPGQLLVAAGAGPDLIEEVVTGARRFAVGIDPVTHTIAGKSSSEALAWDSAGAEAALVLDGDGVGRLVAVSLESASVGLDLTREVRRCVLGDRIHVEGLAGSDGGLRPTDLARWEALALTLLSADMVGVMEGALRLGVEHVTTRQQFGVSIGTFQALQHLLAEQQVSLEGARATTFFAAWAIENRPGEATLGAHTAKAYCSEHGRRVCEAVLQVHGGMGMTWECFAHGFLKRLLSDRSALGDERRHYRIIAASQRSVRREEALSGLRR